MERLGGEVEMVLCGAWRLYFLAQFLGIFPLSNHGAKRGSLDATLLPLHGLRVVSVVMRCGKKVERRRGGALVQDYGAACTPHGEGDKRGRGRRGDRCLRESDFLLS